MLSRLSLRMSTVGLLGLLSALALAVPGAASAAPLHNRGLTIASTPNPIVAGEGVLIYGSLKLPDNAGRPIFLYHRINPALRFTLISVTRTNAAGSYEFVRADGIVNSNRNWFVVGPDGTHSRTIHELVSPVVTLSTGSTTALTGTPVQFTGSVFPAHPYQRVALQEQDSDTGNGWHTIASTRTGPGSNFIVVHNFRLPGSFTLRAFFPGDPRNIAGQSDALTLIVQQKQNPSLTINASAPVIPDGQSETISGTLYTAGSTTTPWASEPVMLYGKQAGGSFKVLANTTTDPSGDYSFTQTPLNNTVYRVETASSPAQISANLYVGVQDTVTITPSGSTVEDGDSLTFSGNVAPDHTGHVINLQRLNASGNWVDVESSYLSTGSAYSFTYTFGQLGTVELRAQVPGGPVNLGGVSAAVTVNVSGVAPVTSLPPAS
jgi:hypothetical protein